MTRPLTLAWILALVHALASPAHAHAFLDHAAPAVGSSVHGSPAQVKLWFTQRLEPAFSTAQVLDASGKRVNKDDAHVDASDAALMVVTLPPSLKPGTYRVTWRVLSVDTHVTEGDFSFDVVP